MNTRTLTVLALVACFGISWFLTTNTTPAVTENSEAPQPATDVSSISTSSTAAVDPVSAVPESPAEAPVYTPPSTTSTPIAPAKGGCYVGGCSSQLCSDTPDMASTCEWRESYACYQNQTCERQSNGTCGWTETESLKQCLANPSSEAESEGILETM